MNDITDIETVEDEARRKEELHSSLHDALPISEERRVGKECTHLAINLGVQFE